jgi:DNA-binding CsgD family transcriptional regulator
LAAGPGGGNTRAFCLPALFSTQFAVPVAWAKPGLRTSAAGPAGGREEPAPFVLRPYRKRSVFPRVKTAEHQSKHLISNSGASGFCHAVPQRHRVAIAYADWAPFRKIRLPHFGSAAQRRDVATRKLSPRQIEVIRGICRGLTDKEIADDLGITTHTIGHHVRLIFQRLNSRSRAQAAVQFIRLGYGVRTKKPRAAAT